MAKTHEGYLLIADITGYTIYLNESELEHAQETLTALLELLVENTTPPLIISRLAGDAVISYGLSETFFKGQTFIEKIEDIYVNFRKSLERLVLNNTCQCNACANISALDLKFFIHFGTFGIQQIADHDELVGNDINLLHRLLKNSVSENTNLRAYALYTDAAVRALAIRELTRGMLAHTETYDDHVDVRCYVQDMHAVWEENREATVIEFPAEEVMAELTVEIDLPHEQVWDYLIQPKYRSILIGSDRMEITNLADGRIAPGSVYQCYHGDKLIPQTILEWRPFEYVLVKELAVFSPKVSLLAKYDVESTDTGTRLTKSISKPSGPIWGHLLLRLMAPMFKRMGSQAMHAFARHIELDYQALSDGAYD